MLRCGQAEDKIRSARGSFIRNSQQHAKIKGLSFFVVAGGYSHVCLYERIGKSNILSYFVVDRPGSEYDPPVAVILEKNINKEAL